MQTTSQPPLHSRAPFVQASNWWTTFSTFYWQTLVLLDGASSASGSGGGGWGGVWRGVFNSATTKGLYVRSHHSVLSNKLHKILAENCNEPTVVLNETDPSRDCEYTRNLTLKEGEHSKWKMALVGVILLLSTLTYPSYGTDELLSSSDDPNLPITAASSTGKRSICQTSNVEQSDSVHFWRFWSLGSFLCSFDHLPVQLSLFLSPNWKLEKKLLMRELPMIEMDFWY